MSISEYFERARQQQQQQRQPESPRYHVASESAQCGDQEVRCRLSQPQRCIHYEKLCDGVKDCERGEDEENCGFVATIPTAATTRLIFIKFWKEFKSG